MEESIRPLFMIELLQRAIAGPVMTLCALVGNPDGWWPKSMTDLINYDSTYWADTVWKCLHVLAPEAQTDTPFANIIGGQAGVLVPSLLLIRQHAELMVCAAPMTFIPGVLTVRGWRQQLLNEVMPRMTLPLGVGEVAKVSVPGCIWRNVQRIVTLQGTNLSYRYKVSAEGHTIDIGTATDMWLQVVTHSSDAAHHELMANASDYVCRNVTSSAFRSNFTTV